MTIEDEVRAGDVDRPVEYRAGDAGRVGRVGARPQMGQDEVGGACLAGLASGVGRAAEQSDVGRVAHPLDIGGLGDKEVGAGASSTTAGSGPLSPV